MGATLIVDDPELPPDYPVLIYRPLKDGRLSWPSCARRRSGGMRSTGNRTRVAGMVAQSFTHYATAACRFINLLNCKVEHQVECQPLCIDDLPLISYLPWTRFTIARSKATLLKSPEKWMK